MRSLTKNLRMRAAILIVLAYAGCVLAPTAALAFVATPASFHCLSELNGMSAPPEHESMAHAHADGTSHYHDQSSFPDKHSDADGKSHAGSCCGLFCVSAIAHDPGVTFGIPAPTLPALPAVVSGLAGRAPGPLHRPPIA